MLLDSTDGGFTSLYTDTQLPGNCLPSKLSSLSNFEKFCLFDETDLYDAMCQIRIDPSHL
jgi:hypothetical protein